MIEFRTMKNKHAVEVWHGRRHIATIVPDGRGVRIISRFALSHSGSKCETSIAISETIPMMRGPQTAPTKV